jgi:hypothetical protein
MELQLVGIDFVNIVVCYRFVGAAEWSEECLLLLLAKILKLRQPGQVLLINRANFPFCTAGYYWDAHWKELMPHRLCDWDMRPEKYLPIVQTLAHIEKEIYIMRRVLKIEQKK